jgi:hypothetical protein
MQHVKSRKSLTETLARGGYVARGVVYTIVGVLAALAATGRGGASPDSKGALQTVLSQPLGRGLLGLLALGLVAFAAWRAAQSVLDADHLGSRPKALARRFGYGVGALVNGGLAVSAATLALHSAASSGGEKSAHDWTAWLLAMPMGQVLVGLAGAAVVAAGLAAGWKAWKAGFTEHLACDTDSKAWILPLGRLGYAARCVVFAIAGGFLIVAAIHANAREAKGLAGALQALERQPYGSALLLATAVGLICFGAFQVAAARYRRIDAPDIDEAGDEMRRQAGAALGA